MKLFERLALVKAGYTKKEIAEIEAAETVTEPEPEQPEIPAGAEPEPREPEQEPEQEPDYKQLYETAKAQLEAAQNVNIRVSLSNDDPKDPDTEITEILTDLL